MVGALGGGVDIVLEDPEGVVTSLETRPCAVTITISVERFQHLISSIGLWESEITVS